MRARDDSDPINMRLKLVWNIRDFNALNSGKTEDIELMIMEQHCGFSRVISRIQFQASFLKSQKYKLIKHERNSIIAIDNLNPIITIK